MIRKVWSAAFAAALTLVIGTPMTSFAPRVAHADTGLGIRLLDAPTTRRDDPRSAVYIVDYVRPGTTFTRRFEVSNPSGTAQRLRLYPGAATIADGAFAVAPERTANELTGWMTVSPSSLDLPAQGTGIGTVTLSIPTDAAPGERYAVVLAESTSSAGEGLRQTLRVGIRTYLSVGLGAEPASDFAVDSLTAARDPAGVPEVRALVHNIGDRALDLRGTLKLDNGPSGLRAGPFSAELGSTLAPGDTQPITVRLDIGLPAGPWLAVVDLRSGLLARRATATIVFPDADGATAAPVRAKAVPLPREFPALAGLAGALVIVIAVLLGMFLWDRRRRQRAR